MGPDHLGEFEIESRAQPAYVVKVDRARRVAGVPQKRPGGSFAAHVGAVDRSPSIQRIRWICLADLEPTVVNRAARKGRGPCPMLTIDTNRAGVAGNVVAPARQDERDDVIHR